MMTDWQYSGWRYVNTDDSNYDRRSCFHEAVNIATGETRMLPWSPNQAYQEHHFRKFVDLGFPPSIKSRVGHYSNWFPADIDAAELEDA